MALDAVQLYSMLIVPSQVADMMPYHRYVQAWEFLDLPSGWDEKGPVLATGYYQVSNTVMQLIMIIDDALARACHQGEFTWAMCTSISCSGCA